MTSPTKIIPGVHTPRIHVSLPVGPPPCPAMLTFNRSSPLVFISCVTSSTAHVQESKSSLLLMLARLTAAVTLVLLGSSADGKTEDCSLLKLYCAVYRSRPSVPKPVSGGRMPVRRKNCVKGEASGMPNPC